MYKFKLYFIGGAEDPIPARGSNYRRRFGDTVALLVFDSRARGKVRSIRGNKSSRAASALSFCADNGGEKCH